MPRTLSDDQKLYRYAVANDTGCWIWQAGRQTNGYGRVPGGQRGRHVPSHRWVYELLVGPIPAGLNIDHLCRRPLCVNPDHLEPVTHAENVRRGNSGQHHRLKTHCPSGHLYDETNTKWYAGRRYCRACHLIDTRRYKAAKRAAA